MDFVPRPPPSDDPLLQRPKIDFDKHIVLVIISHESSCFIDLDIVGIEQTSNAMEVLCRYFKPGPIVSKPGSYGAYCAVVIRRFDGEIVFVQDSEQPSRPLEPQESAHAPTDNAAHAKTDVEESPAAVNPRWRNRGTKMMLILALLALLLLGILMTR